MKGWVSEEIENEEFATGILVPKKETCMQYIAIW